MASKAIYSVVAVAGIAAASALAWWYQNKPAKPAGETTLAATGTTAPGPSAGGAAGAGGPARAPAVEVARVESMRITDDAQAVGSLR